MVKTEDKKEWFCMVDENGNESEYCGNLYGTFFKISKKLSYNLAFLLLGI